MNSSYSGLARLAAHAKNPTGENEHWAMSEEAFEEVLACFSEIDTESSTHESNKIAYLEQLLRLQEPRHLSETQKIGRRFLLDMLRLLSQQPSSGPWAQESMQAATFTPKFRALAYLLERTARPELAATVAKVDGVHGLTAPELVELVQWIDSYGIAGHELALIQPNFFGAKADANPAATSGQGMHPRFAALVDSSQGRSYDYLAQAFLSESEPLRLVPKQQGTPKPAGSGIGEALASVFDTPYDDAPKPTRLKAFFIPNSNGEPIVALSFVP